MKSAPARSTASTSAARREKSAERIEGAMRTGAAIGNTSLPDSLLPCKTEHHREGSEPDQARLITVMWAGQRAADDGIADQCGKHKHRQRNIGDTPRANGPDNQRDHAGQSEKSECCVNGFDQPESYGAALLAGCEVSWQLSGNELREHRFQHPLLRFEALARAETYELRDGVIYGVAQLQ